MDFAAPHIGFVIASYAVTVAVLGGLVAWLLARAAQMRRRLERLEAEGAPRRPSAAGRQAT